jgi:hypothetical protein
MPSERQASTPHNCPLARVPHALFCCLQVTELLAGLAEVRGLPLEQLQGAAELVAAELNASLVR